MDWDKEAAARLDRVPFFIRKKIKKQIEEFVFSKGKNLVTSQDVTEARQQLAGEGAPKESQEGVSAEELKHMKELVDKGVVIEGLNTEYIKFRVCGGAAGCPLSLFETRPLSLRLAQLAKEEGLEHFLAGSHDGPVFFHQQFRIAVTGCPNNCSQPQIADFAVIGQAKPIITSNQCNQCLLCVNACKEKAITLDTGDPVFNYNLCLHCGDCTRYCAKEAIANAATTYQVLIGGKLGRHPHLAIPIANQANWSTVENLFRAAITLYKKEALDGERFADLVQRLGGQEVFPFRFLANRKY